MHLWLIDSASVSNSKFLGDWTPEYWGQLCISSVAVAWGSDGKGCGGILLGMRPMRSSEKGAKQKIIVICITRTIGNRKSSDVK